MRLVERFYARFMATAPTTAGEYAKAAEDMMEAEIEKIVAWLVEDLGYPVDQWANKPPPGFLFEALVEYCYKDPTGQIHGGDLTKQQIREWLVTLCY